MGSRFAVVGRRWSVGGGRSAVVGRRPLPLKPPFQWPKPPKKADSADQNPSKRFFFGGLWRKVISFRKNLPPRARSLLPTALLPPTTERRSRACRRPLIKKNQAPTAFQKFGIFRLQIKKESTVPTVAKTAVWIIVYWSFLNKRYPGRF